MHALNSLVDDTMTDGKYCLTRIFLFYPMQEAACPFLHLSCRLNVVWPHLIFQVRNKQSREASPVTLTQQRCCDNRLAMRFGYYLTCLLCPSEVAGDEHVNMLSSHLPSKFPCLLTSLLIKVSRRLPLQYLVYVVFRFSMSDQIQFRRLHVNNLYSPCKSTKNNCYNKNKFVFLQKQDRFFLL